MAKNAGTIARKSGNTQQPDSGEFPMVENECLKTYWPTKAVWRLRWLNSSLILSCKLQRLAKWYLKPG